MNWNQTCVVCTVRPQIYELQSVTAEEGTTAELICHSRGSPVPVLHFSRFGESESLSFGENVSLFCSFCSLISQSSFMLYVM